MKVFLLAPNEDWICDRFVNEWYSYNTDITTKNPNEADIVWLVADWCFDQLPYELLKKKIVITSVHHIVPEKFGSRELANFKARDVITSIYHVPCGHTKKQVEEILVSIGSKKEVISRPFWVNDKFWCPKQNVLNVRQAYGLETENSFLIGSFQRDTEGFDLTTPKYEKGADLFCNMIEALHKENPSVRAVLAGWRRQYVMKRFDNANVGYRYIERPGLEIIRDLYLALDAYVVAARYEGGPQAIVECASLGIPIVSTDVGLAPEILNPKATFLPDDFESFKTALQYAKSSEAISYNKNSVSQYYLESSFHWYRKFLEIVYGANKHLK